MSEPALRQLHIVETPFYIRRRIRRAARAARSSMAISSRCSMTTATSAHRPAPPTASISDDTRFLSRLELTLNGMQLLLLGSNIRDDNTQLTVDLTNPDMYFDDRLVMPKDTLHIVRTVFLWQGNRVSAHRAA